LSAPPSQQDARPRPASNAPRVIAEVAVQSGALHACPGIPCVSPTFEPNRGHPGLSLDPRQVDGHGHAHGEEFRDPAGRRLGLGLDVSITRDDAGRTPDQMPVTRAAWFSHGSLAAMLDSRPRRDGSGADDRPGQGITDARFLDAFGSATREAFVLEELAEF